MKVIFFIICNPGLSQRKDINVLIYHNIPDDVSFVPDRYSGSLQLVLVLVILLFSYHLLQMTPLWVLGPEWMLFILRALFKITSD